MSERSNTPNLDIVVSNEVLLMAAYLFEMAPQITDGPTSKIVGRSAAMLAKFSGVILGANLNAVVSSLYLMELPAEEQSEEEPESPFLGSPGITFDDAEVDEVEEIIEREETLDY